MNLSKLNTLIVFLKVIPGVGDMARLSLQTSYPQPLPTWSWELASWSDGIPYPALLTALCGSSPLSSYSLEWTQGTPGSPPEALGLREENLTKGRP